MADWYAENFTPDMDTLKFYEDAGVRLDELQRQMEEAEKTKPDLRRQYAISDELGNVYDYDYDAYNRDLQKWNEEHSVLIEDLAAAERDNKYASDSNFRFFSVLKNSSADSPDVQAAIARGKEISDGYLAEDEEYRGVAQDYGNFGGSEGAWLYHNVKAGGNERKHADTSSWSQDKLNA
ncbi:MAG: hypothetical protein J6W59_08500 [Bacteroidales bacterium]|nr:hypothetical protein [Bacteroidales bacterium]